MYVWNQYVSSQTDVVLLDQSRAKDKEHARAPPLWVFRLNQRLVCCTKGCKRKARDPRSMVALLLDQVGARDKPARKTDS